MSMRFTNGVDCNEINDKIMDSLNIKKGDMLFFKNSGETAIASHRMGIGWYFRKENTLYHYEGASIEYWLNKGLAEINRE